MVRCLRLFTALKLEYSGFAVENIIADCMELLLPMAAKKLDLSFNIEPDVPPCRLQVSIYICTYYSHEIFLRGQGRLRPDSPR